MNPHEIDALIQKFVVQAEARFAAALEHQFRSQFQTYANREVGVPRRERHEVLGIEEGRAIEYLIAELRDIEVQHPGKRLECLKYEHTTPGAEPRLVYWMVEDDPE